MLDNISLTIFDFKYRDWFQKLIWVCLYSGVLLKFV